MRGWTGFLVMAGLFAVVTAAAQGFSGVTDTILAGLIAFGFFTILLGIPFAMLRRVAQAGEFRYGCGLGVILGFMIVGIFVVLVSWQLLDRMGWARGTWEPIASPPVEAVTLIARDTRLGTPPAYQMIYMEGEDGNFYTYQCQTVDQNCTWQLVETIPDTAFRDVTCPIPPTPRPAPVLPNSIGTHIVYICGDLGYIQQNYAVLEDGTAWRWQEYRLPTFNITQALAIVVGLVLGIMLGAMVNREYRGRQSGRIATVS